MIGTLLVGMGLVLGQPTEFSGAFCRTREAAVEVVNEFHGGNGIAAFNENEHCGMGRATMVPRRILAQFRLETGQLLTAVEVQVGPRQVAYLITTGFVFARPGMEV